MTEWMIELTFDNQFTTFDAYGEYKYAYNLL